MSTRMMLVALALGAAAVGLCGCGEGTADPKASGAGGGRAGGKALEIAVIPKGTTHSFWKSVHAGAKRAEKEMGVKIIWKGPLKEDDRADQIKVVEDFTVQKVKGIVLAPLDNVALGDPVQAAKKAGIPTVIIDSDLSGKAGEDFVSFVATDNRKGGEMAGDELARRLGGKGKVIMLRYQEGSASTTNREKGFMDAMQKNPGITVVRDNEYGGATSASAQKVAENLLATLKSGNADKPLTIDGIFCPNQSTTIGMLEALRSLKANGKVLFVGFDSDEILLDALTKGDIQGLVLQDPAHMGYMGVKTMVEHLNGKKVEPRVDTGVKLATQENMNQPEMQALLKPPVD